MEGSFDRSKRRHNYSDDRRPESRDRSRSRERDDDHHSRRDRRREESGADGSFGHRNDLYHSDSSSYTGTGGTPGNSFTSGVTPGSSAARGVGGGGKGRWYNSIPNNIILVRELPDDATENEISEELEKNNMHVKNVRIMRNKETGQSLRYCFVEFNQISEAQYWMEANQGEMRFRDAFTLHMYYSTTRRGNLNQSGGPFANEQQPTTHDMSNISPADWICTKCSCTNFQRRTHCRRCSHVKEEFERALRHSAQSDGQDQVGINPCNTLILRGLDGLTTEETIINAFANATSYPVKNVHVVRDGLTGVSNGYAFVEMTSLKESKEFVDSFSQSDTPLEVDGKAVIIAYAKNTFTTALATLEAQQTQDMNYHAQQQGYYDYNAYYNAYQAAQASGGDMSTANSTNAAAALAQAAIMQTQQKKTHQSTAPAATYSSPAVVPSGSRTSGSADYPIYPVPDVSTYTYDETSGYYYDASTGLYYDPNTQYYYNPEAQIFMYWDGERQTYLPAPTSGESQSGGDASASSTNSDANSVEYKQVEDEKKKSADKKTKVAKKLAKDMEKWAKKMNSQKESQRGEVMKIGGPAAAPGKAAATADAGFSLLEKSSYRSTVDSLTRDTTPVTAAPQPSSSNVAESLANTSSRVSAVESSSQKSAIPTEEELTDLTKMACLLCRRAFPSKEILIKHQQMSDLHKSNLQDLIKSRGDGAAEMDTLSQTLQYRDRAKERRDKYGVPEPPQSKKRGGGSAAASSSGRATAARSRAADDDEDDQSVPFEQPTQSGIKEDNVGNKLLQRMGWKDGMGLGRKNQGIVDPIEAKQRHASAGLGARGSAYNIDPASGSYKERARKTFQMYFQEIN